MEMNQPRVRLDHCAACAATCSDNELLPAGCISNSLIFPLIGFVAGACAGQFRDLSDGLALLFACIGLFIGVLLTRSIRVGARPAVQITKYDGMTSETYER